MSPRSRFVQEAACAVGKWVGELSERQEIERKGAVFIGNGTQLYGGSAHGIPRRHIDGDSLFGETHFQQADSGHQV